MLAFPNMYLKYTIKELIVTFDTGPFKGETRLLLLLFLQLGSAKLWL